jgi:septal ring factor EnvC (AmiA/AmiB activator)
VRRAKEEAEGRYGKHIQQLPELEKHNAGLAAEIERLEKEMDGHASSVKDAEAALAAARERHHHSHSRLGQLRYVHLLGWSPDPAVLDAVQAGASKLCVCPL